MASSVRLNRPAMCCFPTQKPMSVSLQSEITMLKAQLKTLQDAVPRATSG